MEFKTIVMKRYATKKFNGKKITDKKLNELLELIRYSASSFNLQPWKIKVVDDAETKEKLLHASMNQEQVTTCSHLLVFCADTELAKLIDKLEAQMKESGASEETLKNYIGLMRNFAKNMSKGQALAWAQKQVYIALGNALNGAKALGFDSCPMEGFDPKAYSQILGLQKSLVPTVICPIGYAMDKQRKKLRFKKEDVFF